MRDQLRKVQADIVLRAIKEAGGDRKLAARRLQISLSSLYGKLNELREPGNDPDIGIPGH